MKFFTYLLSFCSIIFISGPLVLAAPKTISISADHWFPFNGDPTAEKPGYMIEIARLVFEPKGYKIDYKITPWSRSISDLMRGAVDAVVGASLGDAPEAVFPEESLGIGVNAFFVNSSSRWSYSAPESLNAIRLGVIADYSYGETIDSHVSSNEKNSKLVQKVAGDTAIQQNIKKLQLGRIDAIAEVPEVFWTTVDEMKLDRALFKQAGLAPERDPLYIAFSPISSNSKKYATILSDGVIELRKNGELKKILDRYSLSDWK